MGGGKVRAAGGVVVHDGCIAVIHRPKYEDWSLPKGKLTGDERFEEAAVREVEEETTQRARCVAELSTHEYVDRKGRPKVVRWWRMELVGEHPPWAPATAWRTLERFPIRLTPA